MQRKEICKDLDEPLFLSSPEKNTPIISCVSNRVSEEISIMSQTVLRCAKIPKSAVKGRVLNIKFFFVKTNCALISTYIIFFVNNYINVLLRNFKRHIW